MEIVAESIINYYGKTFIIKFYLKKKTFAEYTMHRARGRLNKQKVRHDRRAVADVTVYYLCPPHVR